MTITVVEAPAAEPVDLDDLKAHLGVTIDDDDALIATKIRAARIRLERLAGIAMVEQTLLLTLDGFPAGYFPLPRPPLVEVVSITYVDPLLATQALPAEAFIVRGVGATGYLAPVGRWPRTDLLPGAVEIIFKAGYGTTAESVPEPLREAVRQLAAHLYENREPVAVGNIVNELPHGIEDLIADYRVWGFG